MTRTLPPGFIALHGNRTEILLDTIAGWLHQHPLDPLEPEIILVQSNGMAEWVKMALARDAGICAATEVQLPARFIWQLYRKVLGRAQVPAQSPLDKTMLAWRLMRVLPALLGEPGFEPLAGYLRADDDTRLFQLALRIADLYDQYQVHRPDWLDAWADGSDVLRDAGGGERPLPPEQRWQASLWRHILGTLDARERTLIRPQLHRRVVEALEAGPPPAAPLPRRVVLFGMTHVPLPVLETLAALARHSQVMLAVPNPCRYHWADIIDGREWLRIARRRLPQRNTTDLAALPLEAMHLHAHPLLAAWGRQARDFVRQLDAFDDAGETRARFALPRIDLFDEDEPDDAPLLVQVQNRIRDLVPLPEHPPRPIAPDDRSIVFHTAHSPVRELEVLHDQLLHLLAHPPGGRPLAPRDIVVMVPDIDAFAPAIRAVFGQYGRHDARHIPFDIADLGARASSPLMTAFEWLLHLPRSRCRLSDLCALLDVPAIAARFGIDAEGLARLTRWMHGAGIRWGLDARHRAELALDACGEQNTALFGLRRMLMGYAVGDAGAPDEAPFADIEPYGEVGGLDAELAGALARLIERLIVWWEESRSPAAPQQWAARGKALLAELVKPADEDERQTLAALHAALETWLAACEGADFSAELPLAVAAEAWLTALEAPALNRRFRAGGVTFCTLMPMRAIPFELVCLLGMNDGDYPRRAPRSDFDLMALPGLQRPGDRARRDDDRQLMLEALLSARRVLYLSWCGHSVRDNSEQPPSVLVAQLRDYLAAGWGREVVAERTTAHPLQPFSRRYFEPGSPLFTHAREWRAAHVNDSADLAPAPPLPPFEPDPQLPLTLAQLASFLRNPVKAFFRRRLAVVFEQDEEALLDDEAFGLGGLEEYGLLGEVAGAVLAELAGGAAPAADLAQRVERQLQRIRRAGRLPLGGLGERTRHSLREAVLPMLAAWQAERAGHPCPIPRRALRFEHAGVPVEDWLDPLLAAAPDAEQPAWLELDPGRLLDDARKASVRAHRMLDAWLKSLLAAAGGVEAAGILVGRDATVRIAPMPAEAARAILAVLIEAWKAGLSEPLPLAFRTALGFVIARNPVVAAGIYEGSRQTSGEVEEPCLARLYPDFATLAADGRFETLAQAVYGPLAAWIETQVSATPHPQSATTAEEPAA